ncbi:MAG: hypothetical protein WC968_01185 [Bacilli bacterium]
MKISSIVDKSFSEVAKMPRFNVNKKVHKQRRILTPLAWALSFGETRKRKVVIRRHNMKPLKDKPFLLLCNHNSFYDFKVATMAIFPRRATYIVAVDGFINREGLMRQVGCFGKRKFINDLGLVKQIKYSVNTLRHITMIYPEARYSLVGTAAILPDSLGKLIKLLKVPVASLICRGNHLAQPVWNLKPRKVHTEADLSYLFSVEEIDKLSVDDINKRIKEAFTYDDYAWQKEKGVKITEPFRAEGLEKVLYKCPSCLAEGKMIGVGHYLKCGNCIKEYDMLPDGSLHATTGDTEFSHIPDWYEWQRAEVRKELEAGKYRLEAEVAIESLPNSKGFYRIGYGTITHNENGFKVEGKSHNGEEFTFVKAPLDNYSVHIEFNYFGKGDGISFSYPQDTFYMFSHSPNYLVTKVHFAVEELYKIKAAAK